MQTTRIRTICEPATATRRGDWIQTFTGQRFWPLDPHPDEVDIRDIAHALSMLCRFTGHTKRFWSVAEHSLLVARLAPERLKLAALLHDATEAYLSDISRPMKRQLEFAYYREAEARLLRVIGERFGVPMADFEACKEADRWALGLEARDLMGDLRPGWEWCTQTLPESVAAMKLARTLVPAEPSSAS